MAVHSVDQSPDWPNGIANVSIATPVAASMTRRDSTISARAAAASSRPKLGWLTEWLPSVAPRRASSFSSSQPRNSPGTGQRSPDAQPLTTNTVHGTRSSAMIGAAFSPTLRSASSNVMARSPGRPPPAAISSAGTKR